MKLFWTYLKPHRKAAAIALLLLIGELAVELWHPLLMARLINDGIMTGDMSVVLWWGVVMVVTALAGFATGIVNSVYAARVSQNFGADVRNALFDAVQSFSLARFDRYSAATLMTRMTSDVTQLQNIVFMGLRIMIRSPIMIVGGIVMALTVDVKLAFALVVLAPLLLVLLVIVVNKGFLRFRLVQEKLDAANGILRENLAGMRLIKAFVRFGREISRFGAANRELTDRTVSALRLVELTLPALLLLMNASVVFIIWFGSRQMDAHAANVGDVVAVVNYATRITGALSVVSFLVTSFSRARASAARVSEVLAADRDRPEGAEERTAAAGDTTAPAAGTAAGGSRNPESGLRSGTIERAITDGELVFDRVTFRYPGTKEPALANISFAVKPGQKVAIMGATGAGKSTLFQLIPRLYEPERGEIRIDGVDIRRYPVQTLRDSIGYVPQEALLFSGTIADNIRWGKEDASDAEVAEAAGAAQIEATIRNLPDGYATRLGQKGVNLSGGQKQRLSVARALVRKPKLLLLDDSTSALDAATEAKLLDALDGYACTTLIITQKIGTATACDTILLLEEGRLIASGPHDELLKESELYRRIVASQYGKEALTHVWPASG